MNLQGKPTGKQRAIVVALGFTLALLAAACGGTEADTTTDAGGVVFQGEQTVAVTVPTTTSTTTPADDAPAGASQGAVAPTFDETDDTIPTDDEEDPDGEFFSAVGDFMACLDTEGYGFIGIPNGDDATSPVNDPGYGEALGGCAASTQIVSKMEAAEDTSDMSAEEIETSNRLFAQFIDCLKGRGWTIPNPTPDENGVLQPPYIEIARDWIPPDGTTILADDSFNTDDFAECGLSPETFN